MRMESGQPALVVVPEPEQSAQLSGDRSDEEQVTQGPVLVPVPLQLRHLMGYLLFAGWPHSAQGFGAGMVMVVDRSWVGVRLTRSKLRRQLYVDLAIRLIRLQR